MPQIIRQTYETATAIIERGKIRYSGILIFTTEYLISSTCYNIKTSTTITTTNKEKDTVDHN